MDFENSAELPRPLRTAGGYQRTKCIFADVFSIARVLDPGRSSISWMLLAMLIIEIKQITKGMLATHPRKNRDYLSNGTILRNQNQNLCCLPQNPCPTKNLKVQ
jgi:hypothetical protein